MLVRLILGLLITVVGLAVAGRRVVWLSGSSGPGQPAPRADDLGARLARRCARCSASASC